MTLERTARGHHDAKKIDRLSHRRKIAIRDQWRKISGNGRITGSVKVKAQTGTA